MQRILFFIFTVLFIDFNSYAQHSGIEGQIVDGDTKSPLLGASINLNHGGLRADNSDAFGGFRFPNLAAGQYEIVASHIGYRTEIIPVEVRNGIISSVTVQMKKSNLDLSEIKLNSKKTNGTNSIGQVDILLRPVNNSQDILRLVPGLFIAQHAGGGKAEQIFLRGFDIDHGTDISLTVDGMPVNMVSHAHGQGYADLHFLIPEAVEKVSFEMGPYTVDKGNLATAGHVDFKTRDFLHSSSIKLEAGDFNTKRIAGLIKLYDRQLKTRREQLYLATEYFKNDSYFESPQDFHRFNIMGKYTAWYGNQSQLSVTASHFDSRWNASGQVPQRAVDAGLISRFGSIDNSEGGNTGRTNINAKFSKQLKNNWNLTNQAYFTRYHFKLYSNFTFYLEDPVNGDGIKQKESRDIAGYKATLGRSWFIGTKKASSTIGTGFRFDNIDDIELSKVVKRKYLSPIQKGAVKELNAFAYWQQEIQLSEKISLDGGLRYDLFSFSYSDALSSDPQAMRQYRGIVSPKINLGYSPGKSAKFFLNNGIGFHSNDTRVILNNDAKDILPKVYATDFGVILKPTKQLLLKTTIWHLYSEQEFVYVGDAGIVEAGGRTRRMGIDLSARYQLHSWLFADIDLNLTRARAIDEPKGANSVPLAPAFTSIGGLTVKIKGRFNGTLRYRLIDDRPANETNTVRAKGYFIADLTMNYRMKAFEFFFSLENILNREWNEAQFDTESRLPSEISPVSEIHFTPGTPRFLKAGVSVNF